MAPVFLAPVSGACVMGLRLGRVWSTCIIHCLTVTPLRDKFHRSIARERNFSLWRTHVNVDVNHKFLAWLRFGHWLTLCTINIYLNIL